jgi:hypothetical protein
VLINLSRDPHHVGGFPREHVEVRFEEIDERAFLFRIERRPDTESTAIVGDDRILDILGGLERAGRMLGRLGDVLVLGTRLSVEPRGPDGCFSELKHSMSHSYARWYVGPTVMIPLSPGIFNFRYI